MIGKFGATILQAIRDRLPSALSSGGGVKVGIVDSVAVVLAAGSAAIGSVIADLRVAGSSVGAGNPVHVAPGTSVLGQQARAASLAVTLSTEDAAKVPTLGQALAAGSVPVVLPEAQLPNASTSPAVGSAGIPVRAVTDVTPGKQIHAQPSAGIANGAGKLLFGFTNATGETLYVERVHLSNTQQTPIGGVLCQMNVQVGTGAITGGTTVTPASSPALVAGCHDVRNAIPSGLTFNTGGALGGTVTTVESVRWTTDEVTPAGNGSLAEIIFAMGAGLDIFNFTNSPVVVPNGYSMAVVCDSAAVNGSTLVDFNICRA